MNELFKELTKLFAREVALQLADMVVKTKAPGAEDVGKSAEVFKPDVTAERSEDEWRADCLAIINLLAPTHGKELRALLAKFDGAKRLSDVAADGLPSLLAELASLKDG
ncbi:hypothetical protein [Leclercia sp. Marseille-Q4284]|uniref:hypothetical protein n=1 Tax=Leclercia sp. Marseille-Q4284 TaxID=2866582 RepID=UPI001CE3D393|nr:hypothetical protein [Leclercia sp. Marseille-Q4284]